MSVASGHAGHGEADSPGAARHDGHLIMVHRGTSVPLLALRRACASGLGRASGADEFERGPDEAEVLRCPEMIRSWQCYEPGVGQGGDQLVRGPGEVALSQDDKHRDLDRRHLGLSQRCLRAAQARGQGGPVVARRHREMGQRRGQRAGPLGGLSGLDGTGDGRGIGAGEDVVARSAYHDAPEPVGRGRGSAEQELGAHAEADRVDLPFGGNRRDDRALER